MAWGSWAEPWHICFPAPDESAATRQPVFEFEEPSLQAIRTEQRASHLTQKIAGRPAPTGEQRLVFECVELACRRFVPIKRITSCKCLRAGRLLQITVSDSAFEPALSLNLDPVEQHLLYKAQRLGRRDALPVRHQPSSFFLELQRVARSHCLRHFCTPCLR